MGIEAQKRVAALEADPKHSAADPEADEATRGDDLDDPDKQQAPGEPGGSLWVEVAPGVYEQAEAGT